MRASTGCGGHGWSARSTGHVGPALAVPNTPLPCVGFTVVEVVGFRVVDEFPVEVVEVEPSDWTVVAVTNWVVDDVAELVVDVVDPRLSSVTACSPAPQPPESSAIRRRAPAARIFHLSRRAHQNTSHP